MLGEGLANEVTTAVSTDFGETVVVGSEREVVELPVQAGCDLDGVTIEDSGVRERTGVNVIGLWRDGEFATLPSPDLRLDDDTILLVSWWRATAWSARP